MNHVFIIAEISANHGNSIEIVKQSILKAKEIGVDAVKIQTYKPDTITLDSDNEYFTIQDENSLWNKRRLFDLYSEAYTPWEWHKELFEFARDNNIILFSTPFDFTAVDLLEECDNPIYKIASFEINDIPLIKYAAKKMKPMIISTGIGTEEEISAAVSACKEVGNEDITLLKCTSEYPAKVEDANLNMIGDLANKYNVKVGLSDHTIGNFVPLLSVGLGAKVIEKHFILDKSIGGPDATFSMSAEEFKDMVDQVRLAEKALGEIDYSLSDKKLKSRHFRKSIFISKDVKKGELVSEENIKIVRPGVGLNPKYYYDILGKEFQEDYKYATPLDLEMIK
ncbi:MAG: pseudaminic acid synthase [Erysipelotrichales bacterium]